jgi:hypothetical protein
LTTGDDTEALSICKNELAAGVATGAFNDAVNTFDLIS